MNDAALSGFLDELEKIASSHGRMKLPKERKGRRPMSVTTLLRKEKDGTLYKDAGSLPVRASGADDPGAAQLPKRPGETPTRGPQVENEEKAGSVLEAVNRAYDRYYNQKNPPSKKNDPDYVDRRDGRGEATTITGVAERLGNIGVGGGEHY